jgi:nitrous oxide reductase accessory protein NosL
MGNDIYTPMAFGVLAFTTVEQAEALASEKGGSVMSFDEVLAHYQK